MKNYWREIYAHPFFPLALAFLLLSLIVTQDGGQNAKSRVLPMRAILTEGRPSLDNYLKATVDWSTGVGGVHYPNKAPGSILLGLPVFFVADQLHRLVEKSYRDERGMRSDPGYMQYTVLSFFAQAMPFALLVLACATWLAKLGVARNAQLFFVVAAFFGNLAALFMNSYFGHGLVALLQLAAVFFLLRRSYAWAGAFFSLSLLSEYSFAFQIPALLAALLILKPRIKELWRFTLGAAPAAGVWVFYHTMYFGSPLAFATKTLNPVFAEQSAEYLWGLIGLPKTDVFLELLIGSSRGIWLSQPWLYVLLLVPFFYRRRNSQCRDVLALGTFCFLSLAGLLLFNSSFNGWHGGNSAGPRYLAGIMPCFALLTAYVYERGGRYFSLLLWGTLCAAVLFRALVYSDTILAPIAPLWTFYREVLFSRPTAMLRFALFFLVLGCGLGCTLKRLNRVT